MILIAHDVPTQAQAYAYFLRKVGGYAVEVVCDVNEILGAVRRLRPEVLLISDGFGFRAVMPCTSSFDIVAKIRLDPQLAGLPVVMLCQLEEELIRARELGCTPHPVPGNSNELLQTLRTLHGVAGANL